ncbi:hypothetical protein Taro_028653 [Colocasia esculenta]|uniref:Uncharacterized protein n=1 Tax=Colocasia esculenta TaxID=4460 RepID=A0A843VQZ3_COLES|nr:hypothetical protein [Colocasia esculenta]
MNNFAQSLERVVPVGCDSFSQAPTFVYSGDFATYPYTFSITSAPWPFALSCSGPYGPTLRKAR